MTVGSWEGLELVPPIEGALLVVSTDGTAESSCMADGVSDGLSVSTGACDGLGVVTFNSVVIAVGVGVALPAEGASEGLVVVVVVTFKAVDTVVGPRVTVSAVGTCDGLMDDVVAFPTLGAAVGNSDTGPTLGACDGLVVVAFGAVGACDGLAVVAFKAAEGGAVSVVVEVVSLVFAAGGAVGHQVKGMRGGRVG